LLCNITPVVFPLCYTSNCLTEKKKKLAEFALTSVGYLIRKVIRRIGPEAVYVEPMHFTNHCTANYKVEEDEVGGTCGTNGGEEELV
jgi:hypothetical protein